MVKFSIITVCLNAEAVIEDAILSVLSQSYPDIEYIVIDGGSRDGTMGIVDKYRGRISKIISEPDHGIYDAMNKGIGLATGDVLYFLNADDHLADPDVLAQVFACFQSTGADIVHGAVRYSHVPGPLTGTSLAHHKGNRPMRSCWDIIHYLLCHQACFCKRDLFQRHGLFDRSYSIAADLDWLLRVVACGAKLSYLDKEVVEYSVAGNSSNLRKTFMESTRVVWRRNGFPGIAFHVYCRAVNAVLFPIERVFSAFQKGNKKK
jgi:glycosyltransferase involved in cell wall biosynthesis